MGHSPPFNVVQFGRVTVDETFQLLVSHFVNLWSSTFLQRKNLNRPMGMCNDASFDNDQLALFAINLVTYVCPIISFSFSRSNSSLPFPPRVGRVTVDETFQLLVSHFVNLWSSTFLQRKNLNRPMGMCNDASFDNI